MGNCCGPKSIHAPTPIRPVATGDGIHLVLDSTGFAIVGEGEWAAVKHGGHGRRGWKKLHLGVDRSGVIVAQALTDEHLDDATVGVTLIDAVDGNILSVTADAAYDTLAVYRAAMARGATVVIPPKRTAVVSRRRPRSAARDRTTGRLHEIGRRRWKKEAGYHQQARVENGFFRYKSILGDGLRARTPAGQATEVVLACNIDRTRAPRVVSHQSLTGPACRSRLWAESYLCNNAARRSRERPASITRALGLCKTLELGI